MTEKDDGERGRIKMAAAGKRIFEIPETKRKFLKVRK